MKHLLVALALAGTCFAADHPCLILAPAPVPTGIGTWSRAGQQARHAMVYLAGEYPAGFGFRNQIKDKDVDKIKALGARVIILDSQYTRENLEAAKEQCAATSK